MLQPKYQTVLNDISRVVSVNWNPPHNIMQINKDQEMKQHALGLTQVTSSLPSSFCSNFNLLTHSTITFNHNLTPFYTLVIINFVTQFTISPQALMPTPYLTLPQLYGNMNKQSPLSKQRRTIEKQQFSSIISILYPSHLIHDIFPILEPLGYWIPQLSSTQFYLLSQPAQRAPRHFNNPTWPLKAEYN